ncbi:hypothetical protein JYT53_00670 [Cytophagaceae bacterium AH-315-L13]|nr:hypothetical protein [Cytophagaceae bacterium AH-315-L13]
MEDKIVENFSNPTHFSQFFDSPVYIVEPNPHLQKKEDNLNFLGENDKGIVFLVDYDQEEILSESYQTVFEKILRALELSFKDCAFINISVCSNLDFELLREKLNMRNLILMGIKYNMFNISTVLSIHQISKLNNVNILSSYSLDELLEDRKKKEQFWTLLKKMLQ